MHLRNTNAYVVSALDEWRKAHHLTASVPCAYGPRTSGPELCAGAVSSVGQMFPMSSMIPERENAGTSSFGMSGVNAHAVFSGPAATALPTSRQLLTSSLPLRRQRHWAVVSPYYLVGMLVGFRSERCQLATMLRVADLGYLWDHKV